MAVEASDAGVDIGTAAAPPPDAGRRVSPYVHVLSVTWLVAMQRPCSDRSWPRIVIRVIRHPLSIRPPATAWGRDPQHLCW